MNMAVEEIVKLGSFRDVRTVRPGARLPRMGTLLATVVKGSGASSPPL